MLIAAAKEQTIPGDKLLMSTETSCHFGHLLQVSETISLKSDFLHFFFMILYMYIAPGQGLITPMETKFLCQQEHLVTLVICCKIQNSLFEV